MSEVALGLCLACAAFAAISATQALRSRSPGACKRIARRLMTAFLIVTPIVGLLYAIDEIRLYRIAFDPDNRAAINPFEHPSAGWQELLLVVTLVAYAAIRARRSFLMR